MVNEHYEDPVTEEPSGTAPPSGEETTPQGAPSEHAEVTEPNLVHELRTLGQHLAAALRAAATTPEAERLRSEVRDGVRALEREMRESAEESKKTTARVTAKYRETGTQRVRGDLAAALHALNRGLEQLATSIDVADEEASAEDAPPDVEAAAGSPAPPPSEPAPPTE